MNQANFTTSQLVWRTIANAVLTLLALTLVIATTSGVIYFAVTKMAVDPDQHHFPLSFALVPIFGAVGGIVGAVITKENCLHLCRFRNSSTVELGVVGHAITGLGGAAAVMFVFGITEFSIVPPSPGRMVVLISITFLAGAFGPAVVQLLGKQLLKRLEALAREVAKNETASLKQEITRLEPRAYTQAATEALRDGLPTEALDYAQKALEVDPTYAGAFIQKGRALRKLERLNDALQTLDDLLKLHPTYASGLYNRACYKLLRGDSVESALEDLNKAFELKPELKINAAQDEDLIRVMPILKQSGLLPETEPATIVPQAQSNTVNGRNGDDHAHS